jgi:excisionase family DNA binding protein
MAEDRTPEELPLIFTVPEAAKFVGVSFQTIYRGIEAGTIPCVRLVPGGQRFVPRKALERFLSGE